MYPSDTDVFQELERDPVIRAKFEECTRDVLDDKQRSKENLENAHRKEAMDEMEERRREDEVSELLRARERQVAEERKKSPERSRSFGPFGAMKRQISYEAKARKSTDGGMLAPSRTRGSMAGRSTKGRPSMDGGKRRLSSEMLGRGMMRRKSEMNVGAEMTLMEEGTIAGGSTAPASVRSLPSSTAKSPAKSTSTKP